MSGLPSPGADRLECGLEALGGGLWWQRKPPRQSSQSLSLSGAIYNSSMHPSQASRQGTSMSCQANIRVANWVKPQVSLPRDCPGVGVRPARDRDRDRDRQQLPFRSVAAPCLGCECRGPNLAKSRLVLDTGYVLGTCLVHSTYDSVHTLLYCALLLLPRPGVMAGRCIAYDQPSTDRSMPGCALGQGKLPASRPVGSRRHPTATRRAQTRTERSPCYMVADAPAFFLQFYLGI